MRWKVPKGWMDGYLLNCLENRIKLHYENNVGAMDKAII